VAGQQFKLKVPADTKVTATVAIGPGSAVVRGPRSFRTARTSSLIRRRGCLAGACLPLYS
jgi:hypothetical protein